MQTKETGSNRDCNGTEYYLVEGAEHILMRYFCEIYNCTICINKECKKCQLNLMIPHLIWFVLDLQVNTGNIDDNGTATDGLGALYREEMDYLVTLPRIATNLFHYTVDVIATDCKLVVPSPR